MLNFGRDMPLKVSHEPNFKAKLGAFPHQVDAVHAVKNLPYAALFHEQGLGKTKIALDLTACWLSEDIVDSVVIVVKKGLVENWRQEIATHTFMTPAIIGGDRKSNYFAFNRPSRIYLTHYEALIGEQKRLTLFLKTRRVAVILDEAHRIKNPETKAAQSLFALSELFVRRVIMTGTPVANRPFDIWAPVYFLDGGEAFGDKFDDFKRDLDLSNDLHTEHSKAERFEDKLAGLFSKIRSFSVRVTKDASGISLPEKRVRDISVQLEARQQELYCRYRDELAAVIVSEGRPQLDRSDAVLKRLLRLVQVASNPRLLDESYSETPSKVVALEEIVEEVRREDTKLIVWTAFTGNVDWLNKRFQGIGAVKIHGKMSVVDRNASVQSFKNDQSIKLLIATPAAAKEGLTLTVANRAVFYDRSFSLDDYLQAQDRIHRISQKHECLIENLVGKETIDEWIDALLYAKKLAAQLAQGDIDRDEYAENASYEFGEIITKVLSGENFFDD
jgi:SNF2 family DNA or RNA helicase